MIKDPTTRLQRRAAKERRVSITEQQVAAYQRFTDELLAHAKTDRERQSLLEMQQWHNNLVTLMLNEERETIESRAAQKIESAWHRVGNALRSAFARADAELAATKLQTVE